MRQIYLANPKGGCGKTTLSLHLASYYARRGETVALCDHDPQRSSLDWLRNRPKKLVDIQGIEFYKHKIMTNRFDVAIHDMPAGCDAEQLAEQADGHQVIIPVLPSATDIKACVRYLMALNSANLVQRNPNRIGLVANRVNVRTNYFKVLLTFLNTVNLPIVGYLRDTQNYVRSISAGVSLFDLPPSSVAIDMEQWASILDWLERPEVVLDHPFQQEINDLLTPA
ncbi:MAG: chromosome partitioning protein [Candidatus Azotimanducaceae bacterium]|jgi:chromosome partitioning protein